MTKITSLFLFCFANIIFSQNNGGIIKYHIAIYNDNTKENFYNKYATLSNEGAKNITFILEFKNNLSKFYLEDKITNSERTTKIALAVANYDNTIYSSLLSDSICYFNRNENVFKKEEFLVTENRKLGWHLTNETKKIQQFMCYKATTELIFYENGKSFKKNITAWYCPDFQINIGPMGYKGLPGLIVELNIDNVNLGIQEIKFSSEMNDWIVPRNGVKISREEYVNTFISRIEKGILNE